MNETIQNCMTTSQFLPTRQKKTDGFYSFSTKSELQSHSWLLNVLSFMNSNRFYSINQNKM